MPGMGFNSKQNFLFLQQIRPITQLGAFHFGGHLLVLDTKAALNLLNKYKL